MVTRAFWPEPDVRDRWERLMALLDARSGERILDLGCGPGAASRFLASRLAPAGQVVATDVSWEVLGDLRRRSNEQRLHSLDLVRASVERLPFADETFDAVLCVNVLEALPDRPGAIQEMRRLLRPGGRLLLAHDDYESAVYATTDRELGRRASLAYARATFPTYPTSDGQMGRRLWSLFQAGGFERSSLRVLPLVNTEYRPWLLGWVHAQFESTFISKVSDVTQDEINAWQYDLEQRSQRGEYLYCVNLYVCLGWKPR